jgi:hypothetical protein
LNESLSIFFDIPSYSNLFQRQLPLAVAGSANVPQPVDVPPENFTTKNSQSEALGGTYADTWFPSALQEKARRMSASFKQARKLK